MANNIYVGWALQAIGAYFLNKELDFNTAPEELIKQRASAFVSLHSPEGELRGCIGTTSPMRKNLAIEIAANAVAACHDYRFAPVTAEEFQGLKITVDVLSAPEKIQSERDLNAKKYGVIVTASDTMTGVLLPDLPDILTGRDQIRVARQKGGFADLEIPYEVYRFKVSRHE